MSKARKKLEKAARDDCELMDGSISIDASVLSSAISLKRIADALELIAGDGDGRPSILAQPLNDYGETIGEAIEGQFKRAAMRGNVGGSA